MGDRVGSTASPPQYHKHSLHNFCKQPQQPDFHFKISGFLAAIKLTDKSGYPDNGYPDMQTLDTAKTGFFLLAEIYFAVKLSKISNIINTDVD